MALWIGRSHRAFLQTARAGPGKLCAPLVAPPAHLLGVLRVILEDFPYVIGPGGSLRLPRPRRSLLIPADHFPALPRHRASSCDRCARLVWASIFTCGVVKYWWFSRPGKKPTLLRQHILFCITNIGKPVLRLARAVWGVGKPVRPISRAKGRPGRAGGCECITTCRAPLNILINTRDTI